MVPGPADLLQTTKTKENRRDGVLKSKPINFSKDFFPCLDFNFPFLFPRFQRTV